MYNVFQFLSKLKVIIYLRLKVKPKNALKQTLSDKFFDKDFTDVV